MTSGTLRTDPNSNRRLARISALADLHGLALVDHDATHIVRRAVETAHALMPADAVAILEPCSDTGTVAVMAQHGWGAAAHASQDAGQLAAVGAAMAHEPADRRCTVLEDEDSLLGSWRRQGAATAAIGAIDGPEDGPAVLLVALQSKAGGIGDDELDFLRALANVVSASVSRRHSQQQSRHPALHDSLTGLPNRTLLVDHLRHALNRAKRHGSSVAVLHLDLDRFQIVNDAFGHGVGDDVLTTVAARLRRAVGPDDLLGRLAADGFIVLSEDVAGEPGAEVRADRLLEALAAPVAFGATEIALTASVGIALSDDDTTTADALIGGADVAVRRAKALGGARSVVFDQAMRRRVDRQLALELGLRRALDAESFELYYQPIVSLEKPAIAGVEALLRWNDPMRGTVPAREFLPAPDESGFIVQIGERVLLEACRQLAHWAAGSTLGDRYLSVNVSARQVADPDFSRRLSALLSRTGARADRLVVEVAESDLMDATGSPAATLQPIKDLGVRLVLDSFGRGRSSLGHIRHLPLDGIKVDQTFVRGAADDERVEEILAAIVSLGTPLDLEIAAEGVESPEQARCLRRLGVSLAQGDRLAGPMPAGEMETVLREGLPVDTMASACAPPAPHALPGATAPREREHVELGPTVRVSRAASALGVSGSTLRRWADSGQIRSVRTRGRHRRFPLAEVRRLSATMTRTASGVLRQEPSPVFPLGELADLLAAERDRLLAGAAGMLYEARLTGWFAAPAAAAALQEWTLSLGAAARFGDWPEAIGATEQLLVEAYRGAASLVERHGFIERFGELCVRALEISGVDQDVLVDARRLFVKLVRLTLVVPQFE